MTRNDFSSLLLFLHIFLYCIPFAYLPIVDDVTPVFTCVGSNLHSKFPLSAERVELCYPYSRSNYDKTRCEMAIIHNPSPANATDTVLGLSNQAFTIGLIPL